jgi:DNA mismatch repair ATPase MutS
MNKCKIGSKTKFSKAYYPALVDIGHVDNTIDVRKNILITGPNAAGKTTLLKTSLINVILSQQFGCGFYKKATIKPYTHIHCYINIPDTSGRDSLFQAEARRCKDIIDSVSVLEKSNHFCVFDEIFSGTNPYEAVSAATAFLEHLNNLPNVSYMITTHFLGVCKSLSCDDGVKNVCMDVHRSGTNFTYTYKIKSGISDVRGGLKVLIDLNYPESIISSATKRLDEIVF